MFVAGGNLGSSRTTVRLQTTDDLQLSVVAPFLHSPNINNIQRFLKPEWMIDPYGIDVPIASELTAIYNHHLGKLRRTQVTCSAYHVLSRLATKIRFK